MRDVQVVNAEDLECILGPRPFRSAELRNIDKFRDGFNRKQDLVDNPTVHPCPDVHTGFPTFISALHLLALVLRLTQLAFI